MSSKVVVIPSPESFRGRGIPWNGLKVLSRGPSTSLGMTSSKMFFGRVWRQRGWLLVVLVIQAMATVLFAQALAPSAVPGTTPSPQTEEETIFPTFETQKLARTYILDVPEPSCQITDRNGEPLAQNKLSYNLAINFPTPLDFSDTQALSFVREKIDKAEKLIGRTLRISDEAILRNYRNRGIMPLEIAQNLSQTEYNEVKDNLTYGMIVLPV